MQQSYSEGTVGAAILDGDLQVYGTQDDPSSTISLAVSSIPVTHSWTEFSDDEPVKRFGTVLVLGPGLDEHRSVKLFLSAIDQSSKHIRTSVAPGCSVRVSGTSIDSLADIILQGPKKELHKSHWQQRLDSSLVDLERASQAGDIGSSEMDSRQMEIHHEGPSEMFGWEAGDVVEVVVSPITVRLTFGNKGMESALEPIAFRNS